MKFNKSFIITFFSVYLLAAIISVIFNRVSYGSYCTLSFIIRNEMVIGLREDWILKFVVSVLFAFINSDLLLRAKH